MIDGLTCALLFGGHGLVQAETMGRVFLGSVQEKPNLFVQTNLPPGDREPATAATYDWLRAFTAHTALRRAAMDAHSALSNPHEAGVFVYRGL